MLREQKYKKPGPKGMFHRERQSVFLEGLLTSQSVDSVW